MQSIQQSVNHAIVPKQIFCQSRFENIHRLAEQTLKGKGLGVQPTTKKMALEVDTSVFVSVIPEIKLAISEIKIIVGVI